jgi:predicted nucleic acid-binding protein
VRYWDASALVPLCVAEGGTAAARRLVRGGIVTWVMSAVEIAAAIERRGREGGLTDADRATARAALRELAAAWTEISAIGAVRERALRLVATHGLRAADAMQLGAALVAVSDRTAGHEFVCADRRLRDAVAREGFRVLPGG